MRRSEGDGERQPLLTVNDDLEPKHVASLVLAEEALKAEPTTLSSTKTARAGAAVAEVGAGAGGGGG